MHSPSTAGVEAGGPEATGIDEETFSNMDGGVAASDGVAYECCKILLLNESGGAASTMSGRLLGGDCFTQSSADQAL